MNKSDFVKKLAVKFPTLKEREIEAVLKLILAEISEALINGDRVELRGFGAFSVRSRQARTARNPRTGEKIQVGNRKMIYYRAGKDLKKLVNN